MMLSLRLAVVRSKADMSETIVQCPTCNQPVTWNDAATWRPFCSERCKLIDLGDWASEKHRVAGEDLQSHDVDPDVEYH